MAIDVAVLLTGFAGLPAGLVVDEFSRRFANEWHTSPDKEELEAAEDEGRDPDPSNRVLGNRWLLENGRVYRRVVIVLLTVALFAAAGARYSHAWQVAVVCGYLAVLIACSASDIMAHRIPNAVTYPASFTALAIGLISPSANTLDVLLGGLVAGGLLFAYALLPQGGFGDAKLGLFMGLALGLSLVAPALLIMAVVGGVLALGLLVATRLRALHTPIPYGPNIAIGAAAVMLLSGTAFHSF